MRGCGHDRVCVICSNAFYKQTEMINISEVRIKELEAENARLKERWEKHQGTVVHDHAFTTVSERGELKKQIHELKIENTRLREEIKTWEKALYSYKAHYPNFEVLKEENARLEEKLADLQNRINGCPQRWSTRNKPLSFQKDDEK